MKADLCGVILDDGKKKQEDLTFEQLGRQQSTLFEDAEEKTATAVIEKNQRLKIYASVLQIFGLSKLQSSTIVLALASLYYFLPALIAHFLPVTFTSAPN